MGRYSRLHPKVTMRFSVGLCALASGVLAAPAQVDSGISVDVPTTDYDAVIVGGGPAGLSALSALARVRRNVLMVDSGEYRNQPTRHMHDVIGFDGVTPAYYRWAAREQISHYDTVSMTNGTVSSIVSQENNTWFTVNIDESEPVTARKIVLATGLRDLLPDTPGVKENWGNGIFWCPWCDGHEHADQGLGLIASLPEIPGLVREMLTLNEDIVALVNGTDTPEMREEAEKELPKWEEYLKLHNVTIQNGTIAAIRRLENATSGDPSLPTYPEHDLFRVDFEGGKSIERNAFLTSYEDEQMSWVGPEMGVRLDGGPDQGANDQHPWSLRNWRRQRGQRHQCSPCPFQREAHRRIRSRATRERDAGRGAGKLARRGNSAGRKDIGARRKGYLGAHEWRAGRDSVRRGVRFLGS